MSQSLSVWSLHGWHSEACHDLMSNQKDDMMTDLPAQLQSKDDRITAPLTELRTKQEECDVFAK